MFENLAVVNDGTFNLDYIQVLVQSFLLRMEADLVCPVADKLLNFIQLHDQFYVKQAKTAIRKS